MTEAWRILKKKHEADSLSGRGALLYGSRWTSQGRPAVFFAQSLSLAALEILAGFKDARLLRKAYVTFSIRFADDLVETLDAGKLPEEWQRPRHPALPPLGDAWLEEQRSLLLQVPSSLIPGEWNFILNPLHPDLGHIDVSPITTFAFDERLVKLQSP